MAGSLLRRTLCVSLRSGQGTLPVSCRMKACWATQRDPRPSAHRRTGGGQHLAFCQQRCVRAHVRRTVQHDPRMLRVAALVPA